MKWPLLALLASSSLFADIDYHKFLKQFPETLGRNGSWKENEIEIATDPADIKRIEKQTAQRLIRLGYSKQEAENYCRAGIVAEDQYWIWVRDAVTFPGGIPGTYNRIIWKVALTGPSGAIILPVLENKKVVVNINFRHATRSWEMELPRGGRKEGESTEIAAKRELFEETGYSTKQMVFLGDLTPETGVISGTVPVYYAKVGPQKKRHQDESEAIAKNVELTLPQIYDAYEKGYFITDVKGRQTKIYCRDPFFAYALLQAQLRKLI